MQRGLDVVAVEPGDEMRAVLERVLPEVEALAGTAEAIPLPDASVDAVTVGQAFHWFDPEAALAEMRRVLDRTAASRCSGTAGTRRIRSSQQVDALLARDPSARR